MRPNKPQKEPPRSQKNRSNPGAQSRPQEAQTGPPEAPETSTTKFHPASFCSPCFLVLRCCFLVFVFLLFILFFPWCSLLLVRCCLLLWVLLLSPPPRPLAWGAGGRGAKPLELKKTTCIVKWTDSGPQGSDLDDLGWNPNQKIARNLKIHTNNPPRSQ